MIDKNKYVELLNATVNNVNFVIVLLPRIIVLTLIDEKY